MLLDLRIVPEAIRSPPLGLVLLRLLRVGASAKKRFVGILLGDCRKMLRAIREPGIDTRPAASPLFG